jgi:hypothetical protein
MNFWNKICGAAFVILFTGHEVSAQSHFKPPPFQAAILRLDSLEHSRTHSHKIIFQAHHFQLPGELSPVAPDFTVRNYAFFCRQELRFEKLTKIPFKFRLGSVAQCDYYEGKDR